jgi:hypothetical protein
MASNRNADKLEGIARGETVTPGEARDILRPPGGVTSGDDEDEGELVLSLDGGATFVLRVSPEHDLSARLTFQVPNLPSAAARLALRVGADGRDERIVAVSEPFVIAESREAPLEELHFVRGEPATREAADGRARELPTSGLASLPDVTALADDGSDIDDDDALLLPTSLEAAPDATVETRPGAQAAPPLLLAVPRARPKRE